MFSFNSTDNRSKMLLIKVENFQQRALCFALYCPYHIPTFAIVYPLKTSENQTNLHKVLNLRCGGPTVNLTAQQRLAQSISKF